jgi:hypothetical protein
VWWFWLRSAAAVSEILRVVCLHHLISKNASASMIKGGDTAGVPMRWLMAELQTNGALL